MNRDGVLFRLAVMKRALAASAGFFVTTGTVALVFIGASSLPALAGTDPGRIPAKAVEPTTAPVSMVVRADHMLARNIQNEITFTGHVHLVKGTLHLNSDDLIIYLKQAASGKTLMEQSKAGTSNQRVETMVATGRVVIHTPTRVAYAGRAVYVASSHLFVLTEEPVVIQNGDRISGERITFFTRLNKSLVQGHSLMLLKPRRDSGGASTQTPEKGGTIVH